MLSKGLSRVFSNASKVMLKILQAKLQSYVNRELPDVQAGFRKGRGTRAQICNICWIIKKAWNQERLYCKVILSVSFQGKVVLRISVRELVVTEAAMREK